MAELEICFLCSEPTGRAGLREDSLYAGKIGPYCESCWDEMPQQYADSLGDILDLTTRVKQLADENAQLHAAIAEAVGDDPIPDLMQPPHNRRSTDAPD